MRIVGGMFGLPEDISAVGNSKPPFMQEPYLLFLSARCAMHCLIKSLRPRQVWLPSFLCCSMLQAVDPSTSEIHFFPVDYDLRVSSIAWLSELKAGSLVVLIDYFGFPCDGDLIQQIIKRGAYVLEDASQALLSSHVGEHSDWVVFSPRKFLGVPDGGILLLRNDQTLLPIRELMPPPGEWWLRAVEACVERREFDKFGGERRWFDLFRKVEAFFPVGAYRMSDLSQLLLQVGFDYDAIAEARRTNFRLLAERLSEYAIFSTLDEGTVPLGFPVRVHNRNQVREALYGYGVYPPVHWDVSQCVPNTFEESYRLSHCIMTIPCDQRLGHDDIVRTADIFLKVVKGLGG